MNRNYTLFCPSIAEQQITGLRYAAEKTYRKHNYRLELLASGFRVLVDGESTNWDSVPKAIYQIALDLKRINEAA